MTELTYEMIDGAFRCYELDYKIRNTPTTEEFIKGILEALKVFKEIYPELGKDDKVNT
jgi:hypothetical protein